MQVLFVRVNSPMREARVPSVLKAIKFSQWALGVAAEAAGVPVNTTARVTSKLLGYAGLWGLGSGAALRLYRHHSVCAPQQGCGDTWRHVCLLSLCHPHAFPSYKQPRHQRLPACLHLHPLPCPVLACRQRLC
jgi:hypothetical protein